MVDPVLLAPAVVQFDFPKDLAADVVSAATRLGRWHRSELVDDVRVQDLRTSTEVSLSALGSVADEVMVFADGCADDYGSWFQCGVTQFEPWTLLRYSPGGLYLTHADSSWESYRVVSMLLYLNPADYEGGQTVFPQFDLLVKPDAPALLMFPSNYAYEHEAMPVVSGEKFVCVTWGSDLPVGLGRDSLKLLLEVDDGSRSAS